MLLGLASVCNSERMLPRLSEQFVRTLHSACRLQRCVGHAVWGWSASSGVAAAMLVSAEVLNALLRCQVCTYLDDSLIAIGGKLEHAAQTFPEFQADRVVELHVCMLYTCARLESGALYWWSVSCLSLCMSRLVPAAVVVGPGAVVMAIRCRDAFLASCPVIFAPRPFPHSDPFRELYCVRGPCRFSVTGSSFSALAVSVCMTAWDAGAMLDG